MKKFFDLYYWFILSDAALLALPTSCLALRSKKSARQEVGCKAIQRASLHSEKQYRSDASLKSKLMHLLHDAERKKSKWIIKDSISNVTVIDKSISLFFKKTWKTKKNNILKF